ncbi:MAG: ATP-binding protein [Spirochaetales bacterium]|nr:ATP-binding protein [Spirochaetales bacterium]
MNYVPRALGQVFRSYLRTFPVVMVWGPRQSGKSTFVLNELPGFRHYDLERPADFSLIASDPELFFAEHANGVCVDEAQRYPDLFPVLRHVVDKDRRNGRFVLLGSSGPLLLRTISETLAGRIGILELTPFTCLELAHRIHWQDRWMWGGLPPVHELDTATQRIDWMESYLRTLLERDLPLAGVRVPAARMLRFWTMLSYLQGQLLNVSTLARSLELSTTAITNYLDILEGALLIRRLQPYFANIGKRLVKRPKLYVRDSGILHRLAGLDAPETLEVWPGRGNSFEGLVVEELIAQASVKLAAPRFFYYRTQAGAEVDLLIQEGRRIIAVEIKLGIDVRPYDIGGLRHCLQDLGLKRGFVVTRGREIRSLGHGIETLPWESVVSTDTGLWA